jgi:hypothetical protein
MEFLVVDNDDVVESKSDEFVALVGVLGIEFPPNIGRVLDLNDVERVNIKFVPPLEFDNVTRRLGGGDGGGNGIPGKSALP